MNFFLELVTCYGSGSRKSPPPPPSPLRQPIPPDSRLSRKRAKAAAALRSKSAAEWRPSLCSISEDNIAPERDQRTNAGSERLIKRKVGSTTTVAAARVHVRSYSDDFGRSGFPVIIPAFSPTPFLF